MKLSESQIKKINDKCPYNQGIFKEPYGIPVHIKEHVIYCRYETGGMSGGSCWDTAEDEGATPYEADPPKDKMKVLELVLEIVKPNITFLEYRKIESLIHDNSETEYEYYGNSTDWKIEYIKLSALYNALGIK